MDAFAKGLKLAGQLLVVSGLLHFLAWTIDGWSDETVRHIPFGAAYIVLGAALIYRIRWIRYLAFIITLIGALSAYMTAGPFSASAWLTWLFIAFDLVILALIAISIWRGQQPA
ncbi:hypothetical protein [Hoeflea prorocentri]|uniref:Uncharacterized protein n=1 Tax=Hoeflea prorocentri TaxID=1922333 RepID=A0A9X3UQC3_9HYPH|nr:hypothetical protein [Hoeflea prorocentri]MCY6383256.1 hypothetical protein [Hoeflea prorocentri]MDA5401056.1 hypothetical protein [Hoeflea prorocentri]